MILMGREIRGFDYDLETLKKSCRAYIVNKKDHESVAFVFYSILSYSCKDDSSLLNSFLKEFEDKELNLQKYLNKYTDFSYCIACYLKDFYKEASQGTIEDFLNLESKIFDFIFSLFSEKDLKTLELVKLLGLSALVA